MSYHEEPVAVAQSFEDGDMKQVTVGDTEVLLARIGDSFHATAAHCTHYGAPLAEGALHDGRLICPWHHACFDLTNGDHLEPPGMDGLPTFTVRRDGNQVYVQVPEEASARRTPSLCHKEEADSRVFAVLGGGAAAAYAVEALREADYSGRIVMITHEAEGPYDRVNCSKEYLQGEAEAAWMPLRSDDFYEEHDIELWRQREVTRLQTSEHTIFFADGEVLSYDKVLVCTGGVARSLDVPGADLPGVRTLRSLRDSRQLREAAQDAKRVVIAGASFIAMESAWSLCELGCDVTVVAPEDVPFEPLWGERVGRMVQTLHEENGVQFSMEQTITRIEGDDTAERVVLSDGETLQTDLVLAGIGVQPATGMLSDVDRRDDGGLDVDAYFQVSDDVYAAGDIAHFPYKDRRVRIEHWRVACQHGRLAGYNMAGQTALYESVPFFWSTQYGLHLRYAGYAKNYDHIIFDGNVENQSFIAFYIENGNVQAVLGVNRDKEMAAIQELLRRDAMPPVSTLENESVDMSALL